jgi:hypothetical protein
MGCNCRNKNNEPNNENNQNTTLPPILAPKTTEQSVNFRPGEIATPESALKQKLTMMQSFAMAIASRGINNQKVTKPIKQLRVLSCFGNKNQGGVLPPCEHLKNSSTPGKHFCGGCGCGDRKGTWLVAEGEEYSKLDYPKLNCPLAMPGFTNYEKSKPEEATMPITRRYYIDQLPYSEIEKISVTTHDLAPNQPNPENETQK